MTSKDSGASSTRKQALNDVVIEITRKYKRIKQEVDTM